LSKNARHRCLNPRNGSVCGFAHLGSRSTQRSLDIGSLDLFWGTRVIGGTGLIIVIIGIIVRMAAIVTAHTTHVHTRTIVQGNVSTTVAPKTGRVAVKGGPAVLDLIIQVTREMAWHLALGGETIVELIIGIAGSMTKDSTTLEVSVVVVVIVMTIGTTFKLGITLCTFGESATLQPATVEAVETTIVEVIETTIMEVVIAPTATR